MFIGDMEQCGLIQRSQNSSIAKISVSHHIIGYDMSIQSPLGQKSSVDGLIDRSKHSELLISTGKSRTESNSLKSSSKI